MIRPTRRRLRTAFVASALLASVAACGGGDGRDSGGGRTAVRVQIEGEPEEIRVYEDVAREFERTHPDIDVRIVGVGQDEDHLAKLATSFAAGDPPDVFLVNYRDYAQFATRRAIEPVGDRLPPAERDQFFPQPLDAFTFDGELQCIPQNISSLVVYYNRALFRAAGLSHPAPTWSWEDFRAAAIALTKGEVRGVGLRPAIIRVAPFVWSNGGELVDDPQSPTRFTLDTPAARQALEFLLRLAHEDKVMPTAAERAAQPLLERFAAGKLGMFLSSRRDTPGFRELRGFDWDVASLPVAKQPAGILHSDAFCVSRAGKHKDAAFSFALYAGGKPGQEITALAGRTVPSVKELATGPYLELESPPEHGEVFVDGIPAIRRTPVIATWPEIEETAGELLTRAFADRSYSVDAFLRDLDARTRPLFAEARR